MAAQHHRLILMGRELADVFKAPAGLVLNHNAGLVQIDSHPEVAGHTKTLPPALHCKANILRPRLSCCGNELDTGVLEVHRLFDLKHNGCATRTFSARRVYGADSSAHANQVP
eukprot:CAMPEP_0115495522 /NCGR_PEP_ID=MMETSP0271-20121206/65297_1 /TAXON_ID=71861 /ORGANISM="Scrippsiella trochoidea, Strain CCMP3099" /LENGTH=112 /DNA_ID=CAMNT_0002924171 /DNA_START=38 /DNA_END=373 /DNA_ORIENTATION=+